MIGVFALVTKDLRLFFSRPLIYVLIGFCCLLWSLFFFFGTYKFVQASFSMANKASETGLNLHQDIFSSYVVIIHYLLLFMMAPITMKLFAEEKRLKTFPLLLSSPLSSWQIVSAKLISATIILLTLLGVSMAYPLSLTIYSEIPLAPLLTSYLGVFMVLLVYTSAGLFASAATESLVLSIVVTITLNLGLLLLGVGKEFFHSMFWQDVFRYMSLDYHFGYFRAGSLSTASVVFFATVTGFFMFLSERTVEFHRWR